MTNAKHTTPLPEHEARELIQRRYLHGRNVAYRADKAGQMLFGTVVGTGEKIVPRGGMHHKLAGRYLDFTKLRIAPADGGPEVLHKIDNGDVGPKSPYGGPDTTWMSEDEMRNMARILIRVGPLPETKFWEGDTVRNTALLRVFHPNGWVVEHIDYAAPGEFGYGYNLHAVEDGSIRPRAWEYHLELLKRGNLWKLEHGEPLEFASIDEEARFYKSLGMSRKQSEFLFPFADAVEILQRGDADDMKLKDKSKMTFVLIKYDNVEFGARLRAHTLAKFGVSA